MNTAPFIFMKNLCFLCLHPPTLAALCLRRSLKQETETQVWFITSSWADFLKLSGLVHLKLVTMGSPHLYGVL